MAFGAEAFGKSVARLLSRRPYLFLPLVPFFLVACDGGPEVSLTEVEWDILLDDPEWDPGVHSIATIVEARPLTEDAVQDLFGSLVWEAENTVIDLCYVKVREVGDGYVHIGDVYQTIEGCGDDPTEMQDAFDAFGSPDHACVGVVTTSGGEHEYCAPLTEISEADLSIISGTTVIGSVAGEEVEAYVAEWFDLRSDLELQFQSYLEEASGEQPQSPTVEFWREVWLGVIDLILANTDNLESVETPASVASEHQAYVLATRRLFTSMREAMAGFTTLAEFEGYYLEDTFSSPKLTANHQDALYQMAVACQSLEQRLAEQGNSTDLGCPPIEVIVEVGDVWKATPNVVPVGGLGLTISNKGNQPIRPMVIEILEGDPLDLPVFDGVVDISQSGVVDSASVYAAFRLITQLEELQPDQGVRIRIASDFTLVVLDHRPGEFEAGAVVIIKRSEAP